MIKIQYFIIDMIELTVIFIFKNSWFPFVSMNTDIILPEFIVTEVLGFTLYLPKVCLGLCTESIILQK